MLVQGKCAEAGLIGLLSGGYPTLPTVRSSDLLAAPKRLFPEEVWRAGFRELACTLADVRVRP